MYKLKRKSNFFFQTNAKLKELIAKKKKKKKKTKKNLNFY